MTPFVLSMRQKRRNQGFWERVKGPSSVSYREELARRRRETRKTEQARAHQERLSTARQKEAEREELRREREAVREANRVKRQMLAEERREEKQRRKAEEREAPHRAMPTAAQIERAYQRGAGSLSEAIEMARSNPRGTKGEFQRCVEAVESRGGAYDPRAVCAAQERRKYRQKELTRRAVAGKKRVRRNAASYRGMSVAKLEQIEPFVAARMYDNDWLVRDRARREMEDLQRALKNARRREAKRNPADAAMAVSEEFHGRPVKAMIPVQQKRHYHKYLAELGELRKLVIMSRDGKHRVTLSKFDGAMLAANEDKNQLFIVGGDQSVTLSDFGIRNPHETETLGEVVKIEYFTDKEHLGSEGGTAIYTHKFRTTNDNGRHATVRMARNPDLIYHLRDEHLEFSGGSYEIKAEGIDK